MLTGFGVPIVLGFFSGKTVFVKRCWEKKTMKNGSNLLYSNFNERKEKDMTSQLSKADL